MTPDRQTISHLRHEVRTPLNHIIGYGEMLLEDVEGGPRVALAPHLQRILDNAQRLLGYVNDFLAPAKIEAGTVDVEHLLPELAVPLDGIIAAAQTLGTLVVADGSKDLLPDVERISSAAEHLRDLIQHGATLRPASPAAAAPMNVSAGGQREIPGRAEHSAILVVDDNENNREMLSRRVVREGYKQVTVACDGRQALELLAAQRFDLVLLDIMMLGLRTGVPLTWTPPMFPIVSRSRCSSWRC